MNVQQQAKEKGDKKNICSKNCDEPCTYLYYDTNGGEKFVADLFKKPSPEHQYITMKNTFYIYFWPSQTFITIKTS
jgi:hypothetical protein